MTIYVDILFLENLMLNCIILYAVAIISKGRIKHFRIIIAGALGAIYVVIYYISKISIYTNAIAKILLAVCMVYVGFKPEKKKELFKQVILFFLVSFVFGGASLGVIYFVNTNNVTIQNGMILDSYSIKTILLGVLIAFSICILAFKLVKAKFTKKDMFCEIIGIIDGKEFRTNAMIDTGNLLKEPITNNPVVVVERKVLENILPKEILENTENILGGDIENIPKNLQDKYLSKLKIPFSSLGKQNGMLLGIKVESLIVINSREERKIDKAIIGIYNKQLTKKGEYGALVGFEVRFIGIPKIKNLNKTKDLGIKYILYILLNKERIVCFS